MMNPLLLMADPNSGQNPFMSLLPLILIIIVFYFFMIRPQMKKQKELRNFRQSLKQGDKIITAGGIYGKINEIKDNVVIIEVEDKMRLRVDINSVYKDPADIEQKK
ncbi:MAG: preprotein translocase subunit YajC [Bacteroidales bacterium]|nr:preprotein translocase subunit YajC [Bacteroidales bacterium]